VGLVSSVLAATLLGLSVFFDFNFLLALGLRFSEVPTSVTDHVRSAVVWLPPLAIVMALVAGGFVVLTGGHRGSLLGSIGFGVVVIGGIGGVIFAVVYIYLDARSPFNWYWGAALGWLVVSVLVRLGGRFAPFLRGMAGTAFMGIPIMVCLVGYRGYFEGQLMLTGINPRWEIVIEKGGALYEIKARGLRRFEQAVVIVDVQKRVLVVPSASVVEARLIGVGAFSARTGEDH